MVSFAYKGRYCLLLFISVNLFLINNVFSQTEDLPHDFLINQELHTGIVDSLLQSAKQNITDQPAEARDIAYVALKLADSLSYKNGIKEAYYMLARTYQIQKIFYPATDFYSKFLSLTSKDDSSDLAKTYNHLGQIYSNLDDVPLAYSYFEKAYYIYEDLKDTVGLARIYNGVASLFYDYNQFDTALHYFKEALKYNLSQDRVYGVITNYMNIANTFERISWEVDSSLFYYYKALEMSEKAGYSYRACYVYGNIANMYNNKGYIDSAKRYAEIGLRLAEEGNWQDQKIYISGILHNIHISKKDYKTAYEYLNYNKIHSDSLYTMNMYMTNKEFDAKLEYEKIKVDRDLMILRQEKNRKNYQIKILIIVFSSIILFSIALVFYVRQRIKSRAKNDLLEEKLNSQNNDITNLALYIIQKNQFIKSLGLHAKKLKKNLTQDKKEELVNQMLDSFNQNVSISNDRIEFNRKIEKINKEFLDRLMLKYPNLTKNEREVASLLRLKFTSKQISALLNISSDAVDKRRYRLRQKIDLKSHENFYSFISKI